MRLDDTAMKKIRYLEHTYGQLSNTPDDHPFIEKLAPYGKDSRPKLDTLISFYVTKKELEKINRITMSEGTTRTPRLREWVVEFFKKPFPIDLTMDTPKEERLSFKIYANDYKKIKYYSDKTFVDVVDLLAIIVKTKLSEID